MEEPKVMEDCWTIIIPDMTGSWHHELNTRPVQYRATQHYSMEEETHEVPPPNWEVICFKCCGPLQVAHTPTGIPKAVYI